MRRNTDADGFRHPPHHLHLPNFEIKLISVPKWKNKNTFLNLFHEQNEIKSEADRMRTWKATKLTIVSYWNCISYIVI